MTFSTLVGSPFAKLLFKLLGLGSGAGWYIIIIAGLGFILGWVIKKFFPNVWFTIMSLWTRFKIMIWNLIDDINNHPAIIAMKKWFGTEKKGLAKDIETKQSDWAKKYPNRESVSNVGGFFDALNMWLYNKAMNLTPQTKALKFAQQAGPSITKYFLEQKYKIEVKVDGVEDKQTVLDSVKSAFDAFAAAITSASVASGFPNLIFSFTVSFFSHVSCKTIPYAFLRDCLVTCSIFFESTRISPPFTS